MPSCTILATAHDVRKVSRRDLPIVVARQLDGATTVATTMWVAHRFGIQVFATGGIGGVHREQAAQQRHQRRPAGAGADAGDRRVRRGQGDP